jgi:hypothetical protein
MLTADIPDPLVSFNHWLREILPTLPVERRPVGCLQQTGEVLFVPWGWVHATMNIGETIGVGVQVRTTPSRPNSWANFSLL